MPASIAAHPGASIVGAINGEVVVVATIRRSVLISPGSRGKSISPWRMIAARRCPSSGIPSRQTNIESTNHAVAAAGQGAVGSPPAAKARPSRRPMDGLSGAEVPIVEGLQEASPGPPSGRILGAFARGAGCVGTAQGGPDWPKSATFVTKLQRGC